MTTPYLPAPTSGLTRIFKNDYLTAALIAVVVSALTFLIAYQVGWLSGAPNWFEVLAATINYGATYLSIKQRRLAYTLGFFASMGFAVAYFQYGLLASSILSVYLVGQLVWGHFRWGPDGATRPVHTFKWGNWWMYALATALTYGGAVGISLAFGGQFAFWDGAILVLTILAQFLLDNKVIAAWFVWGLVNIVGVTLYATAGAPFAAMQQLIFLFANIPGYILWRKSMQEANSENDPKANSELRFTHSPTSEKFDHGLLESQIRAAAKRGTHLDEADVKTLTGSSDLKSLAAYHPNYEFTPTTDEEDKK